MIDIINLLESKKQELQATLAHAENNFSRNDFRDVISPLKKDVSELIHGIN